MSQRTDNSSQELFEAFLESELTYDEERSRTRKLKYLSSDYSLFSENDYAGLARHPRVVEAVIKDLQDAQQVGSGAARLLSGHSKQHAELEQRLAEFKGAESALTFPSGYAAACGTVPVIVSHHDYVILDKHIHACFIDAVKISGATTRVFSHNNAEELEAILKHIRQDNKSAKILIIVESLYSMAGDLAPLQDIVQLKNQYNAWLMVDEAHATGLYGDNKRGLCEQKKIHHDVEIQMGTMGKALGVSGGYIVGNHKLVSLLTQRARSFLFTTGTAPALATAILTAIEILQSEEGSLKIRKLFENIKYYEGKMTKSTSTHFLSPIQFLRKESPESALKLSHQLLEHQLYVPAIRFPTVPQNSPGLRISITSEHTHAQIDKLCHLLNHDSA
ncbi:MAG: pyridoxal phosphate-dependent aminotransferase family protein [Verrucomicrobiota bacterium]